VIAVIRQHVLPMDTGSAWTPLGRVAGVVLRLAAVVALYLLRAVLAPTGTFRGLRQMVLDATPVPGTTRARRARGEPLSRPDHDHQIPEYGSGRPSKDTGAGVTPSTGTGQLPDGSPPSSHRSRVCRLAPGAPTSPRSCASSLA
jgi:hypothetical protein